MSFNRGDSTSADWGISGCIDIDEIIVIRLTRCYFDNPADDASWIVTRTLSLQTKFQS